jgi:hypothetical protein
MRPIERMALVGVRYWNPGAGMMLYYRGQDGLLRRGPREEWGGTQKLTHAQRETLLSPPWRNRVEEALWKELEG